MGELHPSDSSVQLGAEKTILKILERDLDLAEGSLVPKSIALGDTYANLDGYNAERKIMCEVYSHMGKLKGAQHDKVSTDVMKMLLIEKVTGKRFRKIFAVCDMEVKKQLTNTGWMALAYREFDIEVIYVDIDIDLCTGIKEAQKRQYR